MFHPIEGLSQLEAQAANVRPFVGDGTPYLKVPRLRSVQSVRLGSQILPPTIKQEYPVDLSMTKLHAVEMPLYILQFQADGMPVLMRSIQSNDGVWQAGSPIFVQGDWESAPDAVSEADAKAGK